MKHVKIVITLSIVVLIASVMVFYVEALTTPIIEEYNLKQANLAKFEVLPSLEGNENLDPDLSYDLEGTTITEVIVVPDKGYIYTAEFQGFQSVITYMIGIDTNATFTGYKTLIQGDTPGLGAEIAKDWYKNQFPENSINDLSVIDGWAGATITFSGAVSSLSKVVDFHNTTFEGVVLETPAEKLARWKTEITVADAVITDVTADYDLLDGITKVEIANDGTADVAVIYTAEFTGYKSTVEYIVAYDLTTNDIIGFRVVTQDETGGLGAEIANPDYYVQFEDLTQEDALSGNIDTLAGATITTEGLRGSLVDVTTLHQTLFEGAVVETPAEKLARWKTEITFEGAVFTDRTADYELTNGVIKVEHANDGTSDVAVIYTAEFAGYVDVVEYIIAFDLDTNDIIGFRVTYQNETGGLGAKIEDEDYFTQFEDLAQEDALSGNIDGLAGATITTEGLKGSLVEVTTLHQALFQGVVAETPAEKLARWKTEITFEGAVITDRTADYELTNGVIKVEHANDGTSDVAVIYTAEFAGYVDVVEYIIAFDLATNDIIGFRVVYQNETGGLGAKIADPNYFIQFDDLAQDDALSGNIDGLTGATITTEGLKGSLVDVINTHQAIFQGAVVETPEEKLARWKTEITFEGAVITDKSADYVLTGAVTKVEHANDGTSDLAVIYTVEFDGYVDLVEYIIAFDLVTNDIIGFRVTDQNETGGLGGKIADPNYFIQFDNLSQSDAESGNIDGLAGATVTTNALKGSLTDVVTFHKVTFEGSEVVIPDPVATSDANLLLAFPTGVTFTSVYGDYTYMENILNIYEVKDGTDAVIGYVYYGQAVGFAASNMDFVWGVGIDGVSVQIEILNDTQSWDAAEASEWSNYDGSEGLDFTTSPWLENFEGVTLASLLATAVDDVAGVSTTTSAMIEVIETIAQYHVDESVGGGS